MEIPTKYLNHLPRSVAEMIVEDGEPATFRMVRGCVRHIEGNEDELYYRGHEITRNDHLRGFTGHYSVGSFYRGESFDKLSEAKAYIDRKGSEDG